MGWSLWISPTRPGVDVVAIVGIIAGVVGTLLGAGLGAYVTWKIQKRQLEHEDQTRFHERRLMVYADFGGACNEVMAAKRIGGSWAPGLTRLNTSYQTLKLIASEPVIKAAGPVHDTIADVVGDKIADIEAAMPQYNVNMNALIDAMRTE